MYTINKEAVAEAGHSDIILLLLEKEWFLLGEYPKSLIGQSLRLIDAGISLQAYARARSTKRTLVAQLSV